MFKKFNSVVSNPAVATGIIGGPAALGMAGGLVDSYINYKNYQLQKDQFKYEKGLQQTIFQREDNATQRRVADLRAAGLSPVLAAGSAAGSGAVVSTEAPQIGNSGLTEKALAMASMIKTNADISRTRAEEKYINTQRDIAEKMLPYNVDASRANAIAARAGAFNATQEGRTRRVAADNTEATGLTGRNLIDLLRDTTANYVHAIKNYVSPGNRGNNSDRSGNRQENPEGWYIDEQGFSRRRR